MLRNLLFASILIGTACAIHLQYLNIDSAEEDFDESLSAVSEAEDLPMPNAQLPGVCWACEWSMKKIRKQLNNNAKMDMIRSKLKNVCNKIGFMKDKCTKMIMKYMDILIEELSTPDDPKTICINIGVCKPKSEFMMEFIQEFPQVQQNL
ncbi:antimicrobial peptide NK-lysin-like [Trichomycterus rosablanca]|uniref:antimicrobial peptide NK-lysin-like n=1 Tax=Trichomycterus rosablanca TaxID=2290929 RepID=UPI002F3581D7